MPEHFTKNTVEANFWCNVCAKPTMHTVWDGRRGSCLDCIKRLELQASIPGIVEPQPTQMTLMERYGTIDV